MRTRSFLLLAVVVMPAWLLSCSDDDTTSSTTTSNATTSSSGGAGGSGGGNVVGGGGSGGSAYVPTTDDIGFTPSNPVPSGEQILFNDWSFPDRVLSMAPDGSNVLEIFSVYRVWAMGVSRARDTLAFAVGDPNQEEHYGLNLGDAIQHTWLYDFATQTASVLAYGNINDECHHFGPGDTSLYVCRRYDFAYDGMTYTNSGYSLARIDVDSGDAEFLTTDPPLELSLNPNVTDDGSELYFTRIVISGNQQSRSIMKMTLPNGTPTEVRADAHRVLLAPGSQRYLYADTSQGSALYASDLDGNNNVLVASAAGTSATYSPDGLEIAYTIWDDQSACAHVEVVLADGSEANAPRRILDCAQSGEFITELAWIDVP